MELSNIELDLYIFGEDGVQRGIPKKNVTHPRVLIPLRAGTSPGYPPISVMKRIQYTCLAVRTVTKHGCYVLARFVSFIPFWYGQLRFLSAPSPLLQIFWQFKNLARHPRQSRPVKIVHPVPMPCLTFITFYPRPETWLPWLPGNEYIQKCAI